MPDEQPYFTIKVTRCGECPYFYEFHIACRRCGSRLWEGARRLAVENANGITPSCPLWAKVQTEPPKD